MLHSAVNMAPLAPASHVLVLLRGSNEG